MLDITIVIILGAVYGFIKPGKEDRFNLFKKGLMIGLILGLIVGVLSALITFPLGFIASGISFVGAGLSTVIAIVFLAIFFTIGTFIGDLLEHVFKR